MNNADTSRAGRGCVAGRHARAFALMRRIPAPGYVMIGQSSPVAAPAP